MEVEGQHELMSLPDELLASVLQHCGAKAVARAATCSRRLLAAQAALAQQTAFASAMVCISNPRDASDEAAAACDAALARMPAAVDFALVFPCANFPAAQQDWLAPVLERLARCLPPGTQVAGCTGRGIYGVLPDGTPAEIDPSDARRAGISLLLGRVPGAYARTFAALRPEGGWGSEAACREWLGLGGRPDLTPASLHLFTRSGCTHLLGKCLEGLQAAFPQLVVTGGIAAGPRCKKVISFTAAAARPPPPPTPPAAVAGGRELRPRRGGRVEAASAAAAPAPAVNEGEDKQYVGLVLCVPGAGAAGPPSPAGAGQAGAGQGAAVESGKGACALRAGALTTRGLVGAEPVFHNLGLVRGLGRFVDAEGEEMEMVGFDAAYCNGEPAFLELGAIVEKYGHAELALWAADRSSSGSYAAQLGSGEPVVLVETMSHPEGVLGAVDPSQKEAFELVLLAAQQPSRSLCGQVLTIAPEGYIRDLKGLHALAAGCRAGGPVGPAPAASAGLVVVSCTAKGKAVYGEGQEGAEARAIREAGQVPMAGVYCDGEIGPLARGGVQCGVRWCGPGGGGSGQVVPLNNSKRSELQGFTTIVSLLGG